MNRTSRTCCTCCNTYLRMSNYPAVGLNKVLRIRFISTSGRQGKRVTYADLQKKTNCDRAVTHFDDFYGTFYGKRKWPQLRLGLLSPAKYVAIPNPFTGNLERIQKQLEAMGSFNMMKLWGEGKELLDKQVDVKKDLGKIHASERTLESIAVTKKAEEMEMLYQNLPQKEGAQRGGSGGLAFQGVGSGGGGNRSGRIVSHPSHAAFMPPTKLKGVDEFAFDSDYYAGFLPQNLRPLLDPDEDHPFVYSDPRRVKNLGWPSKVFTPFTFEQGSGQEFPSARRDSSSGLREYICVNGASIAPVLALDPNPDTEMLDLCSGPGTKSLMALMTMVMGSVTCNDIDHSRLFRVKRIFNEFIGSEHPENVLYTRFNAMDYPRDKKYDRVLADVPCLNDRVSCTVSENSIFKTTRTRERLNLINVQKAILHSAFRTVKPEEGSVIVYSTCTLSPVENDGVVMHSLKETEIPDLAVDIFGLLSLLKPFEHRGFFKLTRTRFGVMIEPSIVCNFGPMYVSRIIVQKQLEQVKEPDNPDTEEEQLDAHVHSIKG